MVTEKQASRSNQDEASPTLSDNITRGGGNAPRNTRISSDTGLIVSFFFLNPLFGLHCVRMLRRKTEVKAQGFTLKAAMRNSVVSHSIRARDGSDYMDFVSDLFYSVCFGGGLEASCVDKKMHSRSVGSISTWLGLSQTTM